MGELRLGRLRYTIAGLIFALLLREAASLPWLEADGVPLFLVFTDRAWVQAAAVGLGGVFALWGLVPIERRWPLAVALIVAAVPLFFVALNFVDPVGRAEDTSFPPGGPDGDVTYAPGLLLAAAASVGALAVAVWTLRDELRR